MKIAGSIGNVVALALLAAGVYAFLEWNPFTTADGGAAAFAESACRQHVSGRAGFARARVFRVSETADGFTVRLSATLDRGGSAKVICLANANGGVRDIEILER